MTSSSPPARDGIFAHFDLVFGIIRGVPTAQDGFLCVGPLKGFSDFIAVGERTIPDREVTITAVNIDLDDVVPLLKKYGGEAVATIMKERGEAGVLEELARRMSGGTPTQ